MSKTVYSIIYSVFFIMASCLGAVSFLGPVSYRHIAIILMFIVILYLKKSLYWDKYVLLYSLFVFCYFICSLVTGYPQEALIRVISYYFVSYIGYTATIILISDYRNEKLLINLFLCLGFINLLAIFGQYFRIPFAIQITDYLNLSDNQYLQEISNRSELASYFYMPGIYGVVYSGYMTMVLCILSIKFQMGKFSIFGLIFSILSLISCFMVQERSSFALAVVFTLYLFAISFIHNARKRGTHWVSFVKFVMIISIPVVLVYGVTLLMSGESRMAEVGFDLGRNSIYEITRSYILDNPFFPGIERLINECEIHPHNLFYNAYVYSGPIGFFCMIILLSMMMYKVLPYCFIKFNGEASILIVFSFAFIAYNINSLVHNNSLVTGDLILWVIWGGVISLIKRDKQSLSRTNRRISNI